MHRPPAAHAPVGRSVWHLRAILGMATVSGLVGIFLGEPLTFWIRAAVLLAWLVSQTFALWDWRRSWTGALTWDGQQWSLSASGWTAPVWPVLVMDLQFLLLLRMDPVAQGDRRRGLPRWIWLQAPDTPGQQGPWLAMRRALVDWSRQPDERTSGAAPVANSVGDP